MVTEQEIIAAANAIRQGALVAFPTETVYGLGANALDAEAVAKIFELKGRPRFDPLIVHVANREHLDALVEHVPVAAKNLIEQFWPGPLSVVLPKNPCVPDVVTAGLPTVAVRCPAHGVAKTLIESAGVPIAAPSANLFCAVSPTTAHHVADQFADRVPHILDGGPCSVGVESTVVSFLDGQPTLLRPGGVTVDEIEEVMGRIRLGTPNGGAGDGPRPASAPLFTVDATGPFFGRDATDVLSESWALVIRAANDHGGVCCDRGLVRPGVPAGSGNQFVRCDAATRPATTRLNRRPASPRKGTWPRHYGPLASGPSQATQRIAPIGTKCAHVDSWTELCGHDGIHPCHLSSSIGALGRVSLPLCHSHRRLVRRPAD